MRLWWVLAAIACETGSSVAVMTPPTVHIEAVSVARLEPGDTWSLPARVRAKRHAVVAAQTSGEVQNVEIAEGVKISDGDLAVTIDAGLAQARLDAARGAVDAARARLAAAQAEQSEAASMGRSTTPAVRRTEAAAKDITALRAQVEVAAVELVRNEARAPFSGVVARTLVSVGQYVHIGDPLFELVAMDDVEVVADGPSPLLESLHELDTIAITGRDVVLGDIRTIVPVVDERTDTVRVRVTPNEPRSWLVPGAAVAVQVELDMVDSGVVIPEKALVRGVREDHVVRIADGRAVRVPVQVVATQEDLRLVVARDLRVGDPVAVRGHHTVQSGMMVELAVP
ncbi:MAG: efflux RND transporter periplasmic adaptor subunit [Myxococcota bacterium]